MMKKDGIGVKRERPRLGKVPEMGRTGSARRLSHRALRCLLSTGNGGAIRCSLPQPPPGVIPAKAVTRAWPAQTGSPLLP